MAGKRTRSSYRKGTKYYKKGRWAKQVRRIAKQTVLRTLELREFTYRKTFGTIQDSDAAFVNQVHCMTQIATGSGLAQRESTRVRIKNIYATGQIKSGTPNSFNNVRCAIVWFNGDQEDPGAAGQPYIPKLPLIWAGTSDLGESRVWQPRNLNYIHTWIVIWEKMYSLQIKNDYVARIFINLNMDHLVNYVGANSNDTRKGSVWFVCYSDSVADPHPSLDMIYRIRYNDD